MLKPLPARLLRYALYLCAALLVSLSILLWQAPNLIQRHLPGWLATHYGLQLTLGKIEVGLRSPSLTLGPSALLDERQQPPHWGCRVSSPARQRSHRTATT